MRTPYVLITCGPASSPIDEVRRITNFSSGKLGAQLATAFANSGWHVVCLRGDGATYPMTSSPAITTKAFSTNQDLDHHFLELSSNRTFIPHLILHAAALCDFEVASVQQENGEPIPPELTGKIPTRHGSIFLELKPAIKILPKFRVYFPQSQIVGWKYEVNGTRDTVLSAAKRQFAEAHNQACVLNGPAWGEGFGFFEANASHAPAELRDTEALIQKLLEWSQPIRDAMFSDSN